MDYTELRSELQKKVFGPYYALGAITGQIAPAPTAKTPKWLIFLGMFPSLFSLIILIARAIYMMYRSNQAGVMTLDWCYATSLTNLSLHAAISCLILFGIKYRKFIPNFFDLLLVATRNKIPMIGRRGHFMVFMAIKFIFLANALYCAENLLRYDDLEKKNNGTIADTARFRNSMFGKQWLFPVDIAIIMWGAIVSSVAMSLTSCMNKSICVAYTELNDEIKFLIRNGEIKSIERLEDIESQIIDFIKAHRYYYETSGFVQGLAMLTFSAGILINLSSQIGLRTLSTMTSSAIDIAMLSLWVAVSISFLIYSMLRPAEFFSNLNETKDMLFLEKSLWLSVNSNIRDTVFGITDRLDKLISSSRTIATSRSAFFILNLLLLILPFIADVLASFINNRPNTDANTTSG